MEKPERDKLEEILRNVSLVRRAVAAEITNAQAIALKLRDYTRDLERIYNDLADLLNLPHTSE